MRSLRILAEHRPKPARVLGKDIFQARGMDMLLALKDEVKNLSLSLRVQFGMVAERFDATEVELALLADEAAIEAVRVLGAPLGPAARDAREAQRDRRSPLPIDLHARLDASHQFQEARQQRPVPIHLAPRREALLAQVPALAVYLPRHHVFRLRLH